MKLLPEHLRKFPFYEDSKVPGLLVQFTEDVLFPVTESNLAFVIKKQLKPLLRPLSELKIRKELLEKLPLELKKELESFLKTKDFNNLKPSTKKLLIKNLFDIDGLIEAGLAIKYKFELKNDLKNESLWAYD